MERKDITTTGALNQKQIREILTHRYPFLLVDKIISVEENKITGIKNISATDPFLVGHFPDDPIYPGVLLIESCAQVGGILISKMVTGRGHLARIKDFKFIQTVEPGDTIVIEAFFKSKFLKFVQVDAVASVNGKLVGKGEIIYSFL